MRSLRAWTPRPANRCFWDGCARSNGSCNHQVRVPSKQFVRSDTRLVHSNMWVGPLDAPCRSTSIRMSAYAVPVPTSLVRCGMVDCLAWRWMQRCSPTWCSHVSTAHPQLSNNVLYRLRRAQMRRVLCYCSMWVSCCFLKMILTAHAAGCACHASTCTRSLPLMLLLQSPLAASVLVCSQPRCRSRGS